MFAIPSIIIASLHVLCFYMKYRICTTKPSSFPVSPARGRGGVSQSPSQGSAMGSMMASPAAPRPPMDAFRSRPPNTSRPPSLHVDDFLALEGCGAQPTGPTGYNKLPALPARLDNLNYYHIHFLNQLHLRGCRGGVNNMN